MNNPELFDCQVMVPIDSRVPISVITGTKITLRDLFAVSMMSGVLTHLPAPYSSQLDPKNFKMGAEFEDVAKIVAKGSYALADAMLEERSKK